MWTLPYSTPQKAGVIALGLLVGALTIPIGCTVLGTIVVLFVGPGRDAWGGFFVAGCFLYGFWLGILPASLFAGECAVLECASLG
jgi:hypothetical protein